MQHKISLIVCFLVALMFRCNLFGQSRECASGSGPSVCTPNQAFDTVGFSPPYNNMPCVLDGVPFDSVIQFHVPNSDMGATINYVQITQIVNIPCGLCWSTCVSNNSFNGGTTGCIRVQGTTYDAPGQYLMIVYANINATEFGVTVTLSGLNMDSLADLKYYARVAVPGGACIPADTLAPTAMASGGPGSLSAPTIGGNASFCTGTSTTLNATSSSYYGYEWSTGATTSSISVSAAGTYTVTVFGDCTSATASKTITAIPAPPDSISPANAAVCNGSTVTLTASGGASYVWSTGSTNASITVAPTQQTTYTVSITGANGCTATAHKTVTIGSLPTVSITPLSLTECGGYDTTLTANASTGVSYAWSSGSTSDTARVAPLANTTYKVTVTNSSGCAASASAAVNVIPVNSTITANGPTVLCGGGSITLQAPAGNTSYLWSDNENTPSIVVSSPGTYSCTVTNASGCTGVSNTLTITSASSLTPVITASNSFNICPGGSTVLSAGAGYTSYLWSVGSTGDTAIVTPVSTHTYTVTVTQGACQGSASATVNVGNFAVPVTITPPGPITICTDTSLTLTVDSGYLTYEWNTGPTSDSLPVNSSGNYIVTVTQSNACSGTVSALVTFTPPPSPVITPADTQSICEGTSVVFDAGDGYLSYLWSTGDTSRTARVVSAGAYTVTVTIAGLGCSGSAANPVSVIVKPSPNPGITPAGPQSLCAGQTVILTADSGYSSYLWTNGDTARAITIDTTGNYAVSATLDGCTGASSQPAAVFVHPIPIATVAKLDSTSGFIELQAGPADANYQWLVQQTPQGAYTLQGVTSATDTVTCGTSPAYYSVIAAQYNCPDTSAALEVICTGIDDIPSLINFSIRPNPARDVLNVFYGLNTPTDVHLQVIDITGRKVAEVVNSRQDGGQYSFQVPVSGFAPGVYLLNFVTGSGSFNTKFVRD